MFYTLGLTITSSASLADTIESIIAQTFLDFEVIIQNNAVDTIEKEKIREFIQPYLSDSRVKYFENESTIPGSDNFNSILYKAGGDYFCMLSDNDIPDRQYLEIVHELILKYNHCDIFHCRVKIVDRDGKLLEISPLCPEFELQADFIYHRVWQKRIHFMADFIVSTKRLREIGGFEKFQLISTLDELTWYKMAENGIAYTSYPGLTHKSVTLNGDTSLQQIEGRFKEIDYFISESKKIILDKNFNNPLYLVDQFDYRIDNQENVLYRHVFEEHLSLVSIPKIIRFYLKHRRKYNFKKQFIYYTLKAKLTNNRWVGEY